MSPQPKQFATTGTTMAGSAVACQTTIVNRFHIITENAGQVSRFTNPLCLIPRDVMYVHVP